MVAFRGKNLLQAEKKEKRKTANSKGVLWAAFAYSLLFPTFVRFIWYLL